MKAIASTVRDRIDRLRDLWQEIAWIFQLVGFALFLAVLGFVCIGMSRESACMKRCGEDANYRWSVYDGCECRPYAGPWQPSTGEDHHASYNEDSTVPAPRDPARP